MNELSARALNTARSHGATYADIRIVHPLAVLERRGSGPTTPTAGFRNRV